MPVPLGVTVLIWPAKDPDEVLDYQIDWTSRLAGDTINSAVFSLATAAGLVIDHQEFTGTTATIWLSGGTLGEVGIVHCRVVTVGSPRPRTMDQSVSIPIATK